MQNTAAEKIEWPDMENFRGIQAQNDGDQKIGLKFDAVDRLWKMNDRIWITSADKELQLKLMVVSHCGIMGHRGADATKSVLRETFFWNELDKDVEVFVGQCFHCILTRSGKLIPRPLATALHGERPNEVLHMDFLYMGPDIDGKKYLLILRDDHSSYVRLWASTAVIAEEAAIALIDCVGAFRSFDWLVSDQGSHFKCVLVSELTSEFHIKHHFVTAYSPWANGSVERVCREVLRASKALCSEWNLAAKEWPAVVETVQNILNHAFLKRLGMRNEDSPGVYRTPLEVFTGNIPVRPLMRVLPLWKYKTVQSEDEVRLRQLFNTEQTQEALIEMHRDVRQRSDRNRKQRRDAHNRKTNINSATFTVGDFVLVGH